MSHWCDFLAQVLLAATPCLCLRPVAPDASYNWTRPLDVHALLPDHKSGLLSSQSTASACYQYLSFHSTDHSASASSSGSGKGSCQNLAVTSSRAASSHNLQRSSSSVGASSHVVVCLGASRVPGKHPCWQLRVEPPAVFANCLPIPVEVSLLGGKAGQRVVNATVNPCGLLPVYDCEGLYLSKLQVQPLGYHNSGWLPIGHAARSAGKHVQHKRASSWSAGVFDMLEGDEGVDSNQLVDRRTVSVAPLLPDKQAEFLQLCSSSNLHTGSVSISLSCSLWVYNCTAFPLAIRHVRAATPAHQIPGLQSRFGLLASAALSSASLSTVGQLAGDGSPQPSSHATYYVVQPYQQRTLQPASASSIDSVSSSVRMSSFTAAGLPNGRCLSAPSLHPASAMRKVKTASNLGRTASGTPSPFAASAQHSHQPHGGIAPVSSGLAALTIHRQPSSQLQTRSSSASLSHHTPRAMPPAAVTSVNAATRASSATSQAVQHAAAGFATLVPGITGLTRHPSLGMPPTTGGKASRGTADDRFLETTTHDAGAFSSMNQQYIEQLQSRQQQGSQPAAAHTRLTASGSHTSLGTQAHVAPDHGVAASCCSGMSGADTARSATDTSSCWPAIHGEGVWGPQSMELQLCAVTQTLPTSSAGMASHGLTHTATRDWSQAVKLDLVGSDSAVVIKLPYQLSATDTGQPMSSHGAYFVSLRAFPVPAGGGAWALHVLPAYFLLNQLPYDIQIRQQGTAYVQAVAAGECCSLEWPDATLPLHLQLRAAEPGWSWSGGVALDSPGDALVKMRHRNKGETMLLRLDVTAGATGSVMAAVSAHGSAFAPYRIDNCSSETLHVQQIGCLDQEDVLRPYSCLPYAWDEPSQPHQVCSACVRQILYH